MHRIDRTVPASQRHSCHHAVARAMIAQSTGGRNKGNAFLAGQAGSHAAVVGHRLLILHFSTSTRKMNHAYSSSEIPPIVLWSGGATIAFGAALAFALVKNRSAKRSAESSNGVPGKASISCDNSVDGTLDKEKYPGGHLTVLYGSQTGTAESFANLLQNEGDGHGFRVRVVDLEDVSSSAEVRDVLLHPDYLDDDGRCRAVFLVATYGEGESTDNAEQFLRLLKSKRGMSVSDISGAGDGDGLDATDDDEKEDPTFFANLDYAVFGLGNTQYEQYNKMGKIYDESLEKLGATRILDLGLGDDDQDLEGDFENWKDNMFWSTLVKRYHSAEIPGAINGAAEASNGDAMPDCPYAVEFLPELRGTSDVRPDDVAPEEMHKSTRHYFTAVDCPVTASRELRNESDPGSTLHMELDVTALSGDKQKYLTADNLGVLPVNDASVVEALAAALGYDLDDVFRLKPSEEKGDGGGAKSNKFDHLFPTPCTVRECLSRYCDLTTPPRRSELKVLSRYATDPMDRKALERMSSKEGKAEYREKIVEAHVGTAEIISKLCPSIEMPLEHFIAAVPRLQPRFYTIASSSSVHPETVHLTVAILHGKRADGTDFKGVCTNHLADVAGNGTSRVFLRGSAFRLPSDPAKPVIMVGPGTGIAPMRALLQERSHQKHRRKLPVGKNVLYFGCKTREMDYLYEEELREFQTDGTLDTLHVAFSREQERKVYVQHLLADNAEETWDLIDKERASIYVCGGTKMGMDVTEAITKIVSDVGKKEEKEAKAYIEELRAEGRFVQELWS